MEIVFLRTASRPIPRILRMMIVAKELKLEPIFFGANREENLPQIDVWDNMPVQRLGAYYPMLNGIGFYSYVRGVLSYNFAVFKALMARKPRIVHVSDIESFGAAFFYRLLKRSKLIYNIHDNLAQRYPLPKPVNTILNILEGIVARSADTTIVPEDFRANALPKFCHGKIKVIRNTPVDPGFSDPIAFSESSPVKIIFAGWLDSGRGIETLLELANKLKSVEVTVAGEGDSKIAGLFSKKQNCSFKGFVNHTEVIALTRNSHFIFAHYDPRRIINQYAAPNKLAEALAIGRPVIINTEVLVSQSISDKACGLVTPYSDSKALISAINDLIKNPETYNYMCYRSRQYYESDYSWNTAREASKEVILSLI